MRLDKILRRMIKGQGYTQLKIAKKCGWRHASDIEGKLKAGEEMKVSSLLRLLEGLNSELIIRAGHYDYVVGHHARDEIVWVKDPNEVVDDEIMDDVVEAVKEVGEKHNIPVYEYGRKKW